MTDHRRLRPGVKLGHLPGDIVVDVRGMKIFVPITTMVLAAVVFSFAVWIFEAIRR